MMDFGWEESSRYNSRMQNAQSSLFSLTHLTRHEPLAKEPRFPLTAKVNFTRFVSHESSTECPATLYKLQQRPLDLQLSADEFINHVEKQPKNGNGWNSVEGAIDCPLSLGCSSNAMDLKLSLTVGGDGDRNFFVKKSVSSHNVIDLEEGITRNFFRKKTYSSPHNVIDLEEPVDRISGYAKSGPSLDSAFMETCPNVKHELQDFAIPEPFFSTSVKKIPSLDIADSNSFQEYSECCQEQTSSNEGVRDNHDGVPSDDLLSKRQQLVSFQGLFDLNKAHQDDSSCCSDYHTCAYPSRESSEGGRDGLNGSMEDGTCPAVFWKKEVIRCPNETSGMLKQDDTVNLTLLDLNRKDMDEDMCTQNSENNSACGSVVTLASPESTLRFPAGMPHLGSCSNGHKNDALERTKQEVEKVSCKKSEENALISCSHNSLQEGNKSPASCRSCCISDNDSSSGKTPHSGITSDVSDQYVKTHLGSQVVDVVRGEHDIRSSDRSDLQNEFYNSKEKSSEVDFSIQQAAELLVHISLAHSACGQDSNTKLGSKEMETQTREKPQYSFDSFELNTLKLTESSLVDDSVSSKPLEVSNTDAKDFGLKLRRGRRMKDFQKEILPSLATLSRHEVLEDINIMEGALRSREYRKNRAKMVTCGDNWSAPLRSRRSRVNYGGRRNYS